MPHAGGRQECEHGEEAETMGKGFERERVCKVEELQRGWCGSRKPHNIRGSMERLGCEEAARSWRALQTL